MPHGSLTCAPPSAPRHTASTRLSPPAPPPVGVAWAPAPAPPPYKTPPPGALAASPVSLPVRACSAPLSSSYPTSTPVPPRTSAASRVDAGRVTSAESAPQRHRRTNSRRKHRRRRSLAARQGASRSLSTSRSIDLPMRSFARDERGYSRARFCPERELGQCCPTCFASDRNARFFFLSFFMADRGLYQFCSLAAGGSLPM